MADEPQHVHPAPRDSRTQFQKSRDKAREWARRILECGIEESHPEVALDVRVADPKFARYVDMMEHIKAEFYMYLRDTYKETGP